MVAALSIAAAALHWPLWISVVCFAICAVLAAVSGVFVSRSAKALKQLEKRGARR